MPFLLGHRGKLIGKWRMDSCCFLATLVPTRFRPVSQKLLVLTCLAESVSFNTTGHSEQHNLRKVWEQVDRLWDEGTLLVGIWDYLLSTAFGLTRWLEVYSLFTVCSPFAFVILAAREVKITVTIEMCVDAYLFWVDVSQWSRAVPPQIRPSW